MGSERRPRDLILREQNPAAILYCQLVSCSENVCRDSAISARIRSGLVNAGTVRRVCGDVAQINVVCRYTSYAHHAQAPAPALVR